MKSTKIILSLLFSTISLSVFSQTDTIGLISDSTKYLSPTINYYSIIKEYENLKSENEKQKNEIEKIKAEYKKILVDFEEAENEIISFKKQYTSDTIRLSSQIDELRTNGHNLKSINDTLAKLNEDYRIQLNEKNKLLEGKIRILQEKEILFAEKEQLYKDAISTSNIDKAKLEGLVEAKNEKIGGKEKEIDLLQKNINEKDISLAAKDKNLTQVTQEKDMYYKMADTLRSKLIDAEKQILTINEELKYTKKRAEDAEARIAAATNRKKKVRVLQGIAMRFFPTPNWDIVPRATEDGYENIIINRNSSKVEFDFVTGASVMLYDLTKPNSKFSSDISVYVGFGGANLFKNFYFGGSYRFLDFFNFSAGVNVAEYTLLAENFNREGDALKPGWSIQTTKQWKVTPFVSLSLDLEFLTYMGKK
ncbi:MAG: hypothetical protein WC679_05975 [Bacteroidales bacterium]|jgi:hypothetical protein